MATFSVVIPCYNEAGNLARLHELLVPVCREIAGEDYEIVLVNDGSSDDTWQIIRRQAQADGRVKGIDLSRNYGHQIALTAGLNQCSGDIVAVIDADLQDPPEALPPMVRLLQEQQADIVYGRRRRRDGENLFKRGTAAVYYRFLGKLADIEIPRDTGDFRVMRREIADAFNRMPERNRYIRGMIAWLGFKQIAYEYDRQGRHAGETGYSLAKMLRLALDGVTGFSIRPLRLTFYLGLFFACVSALLLGYTLVSWFEGDVIQGWASLMGTLLLLFSFQFIILGILGEYIGRIFIEVKHRPLYLIKETTEQKG